MKKFRKVISILLVFIFVFLSPFSANAISTSNEELSIEDIVAQIQSECQNAEIKIVDGSIDVYVPNDINSLTNNFDNENISIMATATSIYAPNGGIWNNFKRPWYTYINPDSHVLPYAMVFLPADKAEALYTAKTVPDLWEFLLTNPITTATAETAVLRIFNLFGVTFTDTQVLFVSAAALSGLYDFADITSFSKAYHASSTGKMRIDYTTVGGWPVRYYYTWTGNYVTDSPWEDFEPVFHRGVYSNTEL